MGLIVYGASLSPFVRKVRVFLAEKGLDYQLEQVNIFPVPDWFAEMSPLKRIPVFKDEESGVVLPDSSAICAYLEKKYPEPALYPADPGQYGRALWYEEYGDSEMAATIGMGTFRPMVVNLLMGKEQDVETANAAVSEKMPRFLDYLEAEIGDKEFMVGEAFSIADIGLATGFVNYAHAGFAPDESAYPKLTAYLKRIHGRPSFAACIAEESAIVDAFKKKA